MSNLTKFDNMAPPNYTDMKYLLSIVSFLLLATPLIAQRGYWQQHADYYMEVDMDVENHQFSGKQVLVYSNNSPDTLNRVFYHLYFNAFQPGSMMDVRSRTIADPDSRVGDRISKLTPEEIGYIKVNSLKQDGVDLSYQTVGTILEVTLHQPILPGSTTQFDMDFQGQVPIQVRRSGRDSAEGVSYSMAQWYPKLSEYDHRGWHPNPYIAREFHGVWGDFEVKLSIDREYTVAATGYLQNPEQIGHGYYPKKPSKKKGKLTWHFKAPKVHDFMWAADPDYRHLVKEVPDGPTLHFFYIPDSTTIHWEQLPDYTMKAMQYLSENCGKYPYEQYSVVQGGDGGMEYPMSTLITGQRSLRSLVSVTVHELIHSWYQSVLATNESLYSWMDEGFTSYYTAEIINFLFNDQAYPHAQVGNYRGYFALVNSGLQEPLTTHADHYDLNGVYGTSAYSKGSIFLRQLKYIIGDEAFQRGMKRYFNEWKFKHPEPNDFKRIMEKESGIMLSWYFEYWINSTKSIDYQLKEVKANGEKTDITLKRAGGMIMPLDLLVTYKSGQVETYNIPLRIMRGHKPLADMQLSEPWPWTNPTYQLTIDIPLDQIASIEIDPGRQMADVNTENNGYLPEKIESEDDSTGTQE